MFVALHGLVAAAGAPSAAPTPKSVRISMAALHAAGDAAEVKLTLQPGDVKGRQQLFIEQGCSELPRRAGRQPCRRYRQESSTTGRSSPA
ncbi:MAG: hypothetical protein U0802_20340 [Candidatus Binatia bacterium]